MLRSSRARVLAASLSVLLVVLVAVGWVLAVRARDQAAKGLEDRMAREAQAIALGGRFLLVDPQARSAFAALAAEAVSPGVEVVVIRPDGSMLYVSKNERPVRVLEAPEVGIALGGGVGQAVRADPLTGETLGYVAVPIRRDSAVIGAVRVSSSRAEIGEAIRRVVAPLVIGGVAGMAATTTLTVWLFGAWVASLRELGGVARRLAEGHLHERMDGPVVSETVDMAAAVNQMAESLERQVARSYQERDTFGAVIHAMADGLVLVDDAGVVTLVNAAAIQMFHLDPGSAIGKTFIGLLRDHEIVGVYRRALSTGRRQTAQVEHGPDLRLLRVVASPLEDRRHAAVMVLLQDISDIQRLQDMRKDFIANASHELTTPLASIRAAVEALEAGAIEDRALAQDFLARIKTEVDAQTEMVRGLLELSRIETGRARFVVEPFDVKQAAVEAVDRLRPLASRRNLDLEVDVPDGLPQVVGDRASIIGVLLNLLGNAVKFTQQGSVRISAQVSGDQVEVMVADTGMGISDVDLPHVFDRFYKADRSRSSEGVGLGLAIAKHLVQAQGGRIWAESTPGKGSVFHFTLPVAADAGEG